MVTIRNPLLALDVQTDLQHRLVELESAWERYLNGGKPVSEIRPVVSDSWDRCLQAGVPPHLEGAPTVMEGPELRSYWQEHPLHAALEPLLADLGSIAPDAGHLVVVTDAQGMIMRLEGDPLTRRQAEKMNFIPGADWSERAAGTNAIGTALAADSAVQILAAEHFCRVVHPWTCSAAVIRDPISEKTLGVIDVTGLKKDVHPHSLAAVMAAVRAIERHLQERHRDLEQLLHSEYMQESRRGGRGLAAVDPAGRAVIFAPWLVEQGLVTPSARLSCLPSSFLDQPPRTEQEWEAEGPGGQRLKVWVKPVWKDARLAGYVIRVVPRPQVSRKPATVTCYTFDTILGQSPPFQKTLDRARRAATHHLPVLLLGESGTGKEVLAQSIHAASGRSGPFVAVNCAAIPPDLLASELFGYAPGAFTGARRNGHPGKFEQAQGGTLFLDEIGEMPLESQAHLLRVLEEQQVVRIGETRPVSLDVRVIAATSANLQRRIREGTFRADLFYRLSVWPVVLPPLRERPGDLAILLPAFLNSLREQLGRLPLRVEASVMALLKRYPWPGNVRELRNLAMQLALEVEGPVVGIGDLPREMQDISGQHTDTGAATNEELSKGQEKHQDRSRGGVLDGSGGGSRGKGVGGHQGGVLGGSKGRLRDLEQELLHRTLRECNGNVTEAARRLGIHRSTIYRRIGAPLRQQA